MTRFLKERGGHEPKRTDEGEVYRDKDMARLDRVVNRVASASDRMENTVQRQAIWDIYEGENQKGQFLQDLLKIEELVKEDRDNMK